MNSLFRLVTFLVGLFLFTNSGAPSVSVISSELEMRTMYNKKALVGRGTFYYDTQTEKSVLRLISPEEVISIEEATGNEISYIPKTNTMSYKQKSFSLTSENMLKYFFKQTNNDLNLKNRGFLLASSSIKDNLVIKTFTPPAALVQHVQKLELVSQNNKLIYFASYDTQGRITNKTYFTKYQRIYGLDAPSQVTDFQYLFLPKNKKDSIVTKTTYHTIKINDQVDRTYLNYKIPANATVVSQ